MIAAKRRCGALLVAAVLTACIPAVADDYCWDQTNDDMNPDTYRDIATFSPFGQEFVPSFTYLDIVQLAVDNFQPDPARVEINIRCDSISGILLATSNTVTVPGFQNELVTFEFPPVGLEPGSTYVIEIVRTEGNAGIGGYSPPAYPEGCAVLFGVPYPEIDLWFREGVFEGTAMERMSWGWIKRSY